MAIITLITDFGPRDHFVAAIKGRILSELTDVQIVDISHNIKPFSIEECAYILKNAIVEFPEGSIHIIGVCANISEDHAPMAVLANGHYFIGADNGIISLVLGNTKPQQVTEIKLPNMVMGPFPTLNIFTPVACHLARGGKLEVVSKTAKGLKEVKSVEARIENNGNAIVGHVIHIDHIGNVVTNIGKNLFEAYRNGRKFELLARRHRLTAIHLTYNGIIDYSLPQHQRKGESDYLAIFNAAGFIELAIYKGATNGSGSASTLLGLNYQDQITINFL